MKKNIAVIAGVIILTVSGLAYAQTNDKGMEMKGDKAGMMEKGMMGGKMMKCMGMMKQMHSSLVATSDGGVVVLSGNKLIKYDNQLNIVKEADLPRAEMGMMGKGMGSMAMDKDDDEEEGAEADKAAMDHAAHH